MKARQRNTIVGLMIFALTGLLTFQVYWINNALELSKTQFTRNVQESLVKVAGQIEEQEAMQLTQRTFVYFNQNKDRSNLEMKENSRVWINESSTGGRQLKYRIHRDSVIVLPQLDSEKAEERIRKKVELVDVAVQRIFTRGKLDIAKRIKNEQVDSLLRKALDEKGISITYNYGVIENSNTGKEHIVLTNTDKSDNEVLKSSFRASLFPNDIQGPEHFLTVYFPNQSIYILREIGMTLFASIVFIGIILGSFIYTMKVIGKQKKLSQIKSDFINNMTHEFKTPIATISLASEVLSEVGMENNYEARQKYIAVIREENNRLARQVERVLESSLLENNQLLLETELISLNDLLKTCIGTFQAVNPDFEFKTEYNATKDTVSADVHHFTNVINNLFDNAVKYSREIKKIEIKTMSAPGLIILTVRDHGIGMESAQLTYIFDDFYRIPTGNLHDVKGFGLGLSYVRRIVEMHQGKIRVRSSPGKGSEFIIEIPYAE
ncbi:MAG: HAMP domain-containing sensor histidine kinase [Cyclobacteriaceae bacterium]